MSDVVDQALAKYIEAAAESKSGSALKEVVAAEGLRAFMGEKVKGYNILNQALANECYLHANGLAANQQKILNAPLANIMPYPGYGPVNNFQLGVPMMPPTPPAPAPQVQAQPPAPILVPRQRTWRDWLWPLVAAGLLGTTGGLAGYLLGNSGDEPIPASEIDPDVGIEIDG